MEYEEQGGSSWSLLRRCLWVSCCVHHQVVAKMEVELSWTPVNVVGSEGSQAKIFIKGDCGTIWTQVQRWLALSCFRCHWSFHEIGVTLVLKMKRISYFLNSVWQAMQNVHVLRLAFESKHDGILSCTVMCRNFKSALLFTYFSLSRKKTFMQSFKLVMINHFPGLIQCFWLLLSHFLCFQHVVQCAI